MYRLRFRLAYLGLFCLLASSPLLAVGCGHTVTHGSPAASVVDRFFVAVEHLQTARAKGDPQAALTAAAAACGLLGTDWYQAPPSMPRDRAGMRRCAVYSVETSPPVTSHQVTATTVTTSGATVHVTIHGTTNTASLVAVLRVEQGAWLIEKFSRAA